MKSTIHLGYESPGGAPVRIPVDHMIITGRTQQSGKTTTAEACAHRVDAPVLAFVTKRDEHGFRDAATVPPMYHGRVDWEWVVSILNAGLDHPDIDDGWIIRLCEAGAFKAQKWAKPKTLADVLANCETALRSSNATGLHKLRTYLRKVVPSVAGLTPTTKLPKLRPGINMMDLRGYPLAVQFIIMGNTLEWVYQHARGIIVLIPEAQKFFPLKSTTPLKKIGESIINERAAAPVFLWLDTQMLRNLDTSMRGQIGVWLFGVQQEVNEAKRTIEHLPEHLSPPTVGQLMSLRRGFFVASYRGKLVPKLYVQPFFVGHEHARAIAMGEENAETIDAIWEEKKGQIKQGGNDAEEKAADPVGDGTQSSESEKTTEAPQPAGWIVGSSQDSGNGGASDRGDYDRQCDTGFCPENDETDEEGQTREEIRQQATPIDSDVPWQCACGASFYEANAAAAAEHAESCPAMFAYLNRTNEETMWEERFNALVSLVEKFMGASVSRMDEVGQARGMMEFRLNPSEFAKEIARLQNLAPDRAGPDTPGNRGAGNGAAQEPAPAGPHPETILAGVSSDELWAVIKERARREAPAILAILAAQPELHVKMERPVIPADGVLVPLGQLLKEGFFNGKGAKSKDVENEFSRRGRKEVRPTIYKGLQELCRLGFLTKEEIGKREYQYRTGPGMKVVVSEK